MQSIELDAIMQKLSTKQWNIGQREHFSCIFFYMILIGMSQITWDSHRHRPIELNEFYSQNSHKVTSNARNKFVMRGVWWPFKTVSCNLFELTPSVKINEILWVLLCDVFFTRQSSVKRWQFVMSTTLRWNSILINFIGLSAQDLYSFSSFFGMVCASYLILWKANNAEKQIVWNYQREYPLFNLLVHSNKVAAIQTSLFAL